MKIEMGESLFYSWLRHVKECQIVQTNWRPSPSWQLQNEGDLRQLIESTDEFFQNKYGYAIYKKSTQSQLLSQAEVDVLGISVSGADMKVYAVDVAFHENGLKYGDRYETVSRIIKKLARNTLCLIGYLDVRGGEIIFASPKIYKAILEDLMPCISDLNEILHKYGYDFTLRIIANDDFRDLVMEPILISSNEVSDTSELFMRSYQLTKMFDSEPKRIKNQSKRPEVKEVIHTDGLSELKIGKIAQNILIPVLKSNAVNEEEIILMRTKEYSKQTFGIDFPLLVLANEEYERERYYITKPFNIRGVPHLLCSQWFETPANNDRPLLIAWLKEHGAMGDET